MDWELLERLKGLNLRRLLSLQLEIRPSLRNVPYWVAAILVGLFAVIYSGLFTGSIDFAQWLATAHSAIFLLLAPCFFFLSTWVVDRFAPAAGGTGVPQVIHALELEYAAAPQEIDRILNMRVFLIIVVSSLANIAGGGSMGREGPIVQLSACLFYYVGKQFSKIWPYQGHRSWIIAGGAAGIAAAFNAPLAGIVFVLEELAQQHFHQFKTVIISAVIIAGMVAQWLSGRYLYLGYPRIDEVSAWTVPRAMLVGILCGVVAGFFLRAVRYYRAKTQPLLEKHRFLFAAGLGVAVAVLAIFVDKRTVGGGTDVIQDLLFRGEQASWRLILGRLVALILSHLSGCAGGFLAPALSMGALIGSKTAWLLSPRDHNLLVMVGMAGFLSAVFRAPFTALVIVMEMTDRHSAIFPLAITSLISFGVVRLMTGKGQVGTGPNAAKAEKT